MTLSGFMWECSCGHVAYCEEEPEECMKCGNLSNFIKMPEEIVEEREKDLLEELKKPKSLKVKTKTRRKK